MTTKKHLIENVLSDYSDDTILAIPAIWTKGDAEGAYEYHKGDSIALTNEEWATVVDLFMNYDYQDTEGMLEAIHEVMHRREENNK